MALDEEQRSLWKTRISQALAMQAEQHKRWRDSLDFIKLQWFDKHQGSDEERIEVHWAWSYKNTIIPTLYARDPQMFVKPRTSNRTPFANTMEEVLEYEKDERKLKESVQMAIGDVVPHGLSWIEVGIHFKDGIPPKQEPVEEPGFLERGQNFINQLTQGEQKPEKEETVPVEGQLFSEVREGELFIRWWSAWKVLLAPGYHLIRQMPYLITIEDVEPEEFLTDSRFSDKDKEMVEPTRQLTIGGGSIRHGHENNKRRGNSTDPALTMIRLFNVWDRRNQEILVFAENFHKELFHADWPYAFDEFPMVPLLWNDTPPSDEDQSPYPIDDITPVKPQLIEKSMLRTSMVKARRRNAPMIIVDTDFVPEQDIQKLQTNEEAVIIGIPGGSKYIQPVNPVTIPGDVFKVDGTIDNDLNIVSGFSQLLLAGQAPPGIDTATEASLVAGGTNLRTGRKTDIVEEFVKEIGRRKIAMVWEFYPRDKIADILNKTISEEMWPEIHNLPIEERRRLIRSELSIRIDAGATQPEQVRLVENNMWIKAVNMLKAAFPDRFIDDKLIEQTLKKLGMKELEYVVKSFDEEEKRVAQQENERLLKGMPQSVSPNVLHSIHIPIHGQAGEQAAAQGIDTTELDKHTLLHAQAMQRNAPKSSPQQGDLTSPAQAAVPEIQRTGTERLPDILGQAESAGVGLEGGVFPQ
ncbi:hypothetical protein IIA15_10030 [candidate division TA06 bacterium]|nr:hypothetical protein [candidate division TA06 bacterium]